MGYTHYYREQNEQMTQEQKDIANWLYANLLKIIIAPESAMTNHPRTTLLALWYDYFRDPKYPGREQQFDENFHEWHTNAARDPLVYGTDEGNFMKTARKRYDLAVYAVLKTVSDYLHIPFSSDAGFDPDEPPDLINYAAEELNSSHGIYPYEYWVFDLLCEDAGKRLAATIPVSALGIHIAWTDPEEAAQTAEDAYKIWELMIFWPVSVDDLRHIANQIWAGYYNSPKDGMYMWQPAWAITNNATNENG